MTKTVDVENVSFAYGDTEVLTDVSFSVKEADTTRSSVLTVRASRRFSSSLSEGSHPTRERRVSSTNLPTYSTRADVSVTSHRTRPVLANVCP